MRPVGWASTLHGARSLLALATPVLVTVIVVAAVSITAVAVAVVALAAEARRLGRSVAELRARIDPVLEELSAGTAEVQARLERLAREGGEDRSG